MTYTGIIYKNYIHKTKLTKTLSPTTFSSWSWRVISCSEILSSFCSRPVPPNETYATYKVLAKVKAKGQGHRVSTFLYLCVCHWGSQLKKRRQRTDRQLVYRSAQYSISRRWKYTITKWKRKIAFNSRIQSYRKFKYARNITWGTDKCRLISQIWKKCRQNIE